MLTPAGVLADMSDTSRRIRTVPIVFTIRSDDTPSGDTVPIVIAVIVVEALDRLTISKLAPFICRAVVVVDAGRVQVAHPVHAIGAIGTIVITPTPGDFLALIGDTNPTIGALRIVGAFRIIIAGTREGVAVLARRTIIIVSAFRVFVTASVQARRVWSAVGVDAALRFILNAYAIEAIMTVWAVYGCPTFRLVWITLSVPVAVVAVRAVPVIPALAVVPATNAVFAEHIVRAIPIVPAVPHTKPADTVVFAGHVRRAVPVVPTLAVAPTADVVFADHFGRTIPVIPTLAVAPTTKTIGVAEHLGWAVPIFPAVPFAPTTDASLFIAEHVGWTIPIFPAFSSPWPTETIGVAEHLRRAVPITAAFVGSRDALPIFTDFVPWALLVEPTFVFWILT